MPKSQLVAEPNDHCLTPVESFAMFRVGRRSQLPRSNSITTGQIQGGLVKKNGYQRLFPTEEFATFRRTTK
jgi:hypothetical protein